jgi:hypothetical protein
MLRLSFFALGVIVCTAVAGCDVGDYTFNGTDNPIDSSTGDGTTPDGDAVVDPDTDPGDGGCKTNLDCTGRLDTPFCNPVSGQCVECITSDNCKAAKHICKANACVEVQCTDNTHCASTPGDAGVDADNPDAKFSALTCDTTTNLCVGCKTDDQCPAGFLCTVSDGACRPGCTEAHACQTGRDCCSGSCLDTTKTVANCGGCGIACPTPANTTMNCEKDPTTMKGVCKVASCAAGWADCNSSTTGGAADGCETDIFTQLANCGGCGTACTIANGSGVCEGGTCKVATCSAGFGNCDGDSTNGCEQTLNTAVHCGACGTACAPANATGDCATVPGTCKVAACNTGFGNCDGSDGNGCEINLKTNAVNCNTCGNVCPSTGGTPACVAGVCKFSSCAPGTGDCDGTGSCSTTLTSNVNNCGACGRTCVAANGTPQCIGTACSIASCSTGFGDCNASYIDGCEQKLDTVANCGGCGIACSRTNATATCSTGSCKINTCAANFGNCDLNDANGCEKSLATDVNNCGLCGKVCAVTNGTASCSGGTCGVASCSPGFANCDGNVADCERAFGTAANTCASPETILDSMGTDFCGYNRTETGTATTTTTKFFKLRLLASGCSGVCKAGDQVRARFTLANPTGIAYDLFVYKGTTCGTPVASITGTTGGTASVDYNTMACLDTDLIVEVRYKSGLNCAAAQIGVTSAF